VVGEIIDGRLPGLVLERPSLRRVYRFTAQDLEAYVQRHRWRTPAK
jgi:hypothetical protein